jgi:hypothetical protein
MNRSGLAGTYLNNYESEGPLFGAALVACDPAF